jgi:hypothetical protein
MTYDEPRTGEGLHKRGVQDIPAKEVDNVRQRELASLNKPKGQRDLVRRDLTSQNLQPHDRRATQGRFPDDNFRRPRRRNSPPPDTRPLPRVPADEDPTGESATEIAAPEAKTSATALTATLIPPSTVL